MSQNRRFLFWEGLHDQMMMLDDGRAGAYIKGISRYAFEGVEPDFGGDEMLVGTPDAGATSMAKFFEGLAKE